MTKRKDYPTAIETEVLVMSARRCCICFGLEGDFTEKRGQITHLDHDPSNSAFDNLAFMCLKHHDEYDSRTSQSKGMRIDEAKHYRDTLYSRVAKELPGRGEEPHVVPEHDEQAVLDVSILQLMARTQSRQTPLSQCVTDALVLAQKAKNSPLERFCKDELSGYFENEARAPSYRDIEGFATYEARINPSFFGWGDSTAAVLDYMRTQKEFHATKLRILNSVSDIESELPTKPPGLIASITMKASRFDPNTSHPDYPVVVYMRPDVYSHIYELIRQDLIRRLVAMLPQDRA